MSRRRHRYTMSEANSQQVYNCTATKLLDLNIMGDYWSLALLTILEMGE